MKILLGDILQSKAQTLVNTVNCVGIMGKGIALEFKKRFPEMFEDYAERCERKEVKPLQARIRTAASGPHYLRHRGCRSICHFLRSGTHGSRLAVAIVIAGLAIAIGLAVGLRRRQGPTAGPGEAAN